MSASSSNWFGVMLLTLCLTGMTKSKSGMRSCDKQLLPELTFRIGSNNLDWPCEGTQNIFEVAGRYQARNIIATRVQIYKDEAFVAMPRYKPGVPFTLGVLSLRSKQCSPKVGPFPCWLIQEEGNCEAMQSAIDIYLDPHNILWVLDTGLVNTLELQPIRRCPPKVVAIDVKTGKVLKVIDLSELVLESSRLQYLVVDCTLDGDKFLYISDASTRSLIIYDVTEDRGSRLILPESVAEGCTNLDVLYILLARKTSTGHPELYLTYLDSESLFKIEVDDLREERLNGTVPEVGLKHKSIVLLGTDNGNAIFFRNEGESAVMMWNTDTEFCPDNLIEVQSGNECRLPTQVVPGYKRLVWCIESNFHDYVENKVGSTGASVSLHPLVKSPDDG